MTAQYSLFATCPRYLEDLLLDELQSLGVQQARSSVGGVRFSASLSQAYRVCLWSRLANRVLLRLTHGKVANKDAVYALAASVPWVEHFGEAGSAPRPASFVVDFAGTSGFIRNSHFGAQLVKDAIVDQFRDQIRPSVDKQNPDLRINAHLTKGQLTLALDLSGDSLHRRGYRQGTGEAPLKENLAAAILIRAGWPEQVSNADHAKPPALIDPLCGTGTLLAEAGMITADIAPGLLRARWGFEAWASHDGQAWQSILSDAQQRKRVGLERVKQSSQRCFGFDQDARAIETAAAVCRRVGITDFVDLACQELTQLANPGFNTGLLVSNPPYGERLGEVRELRGLYNELSQLLKTQFGGWRAAVFSANLDLLDELRLRAERKYRLRNGPLEAQLRLFGIGSTSSADGARSNASAAHSRSQIAPPAELCNRLRKNKQRLEKELKRYQTDCYRLYDADLPEYASAIDCYAGYVVVTEYLAPKSVDPRKAQQRLQATVIATQEVMQVERDRIVVKQKRRQKGSGQYQRISDTGELFEVHEGQARFLVNLHDYHDTGLFLDHRPVRRLISEAARERRFLNLFCYTASSTVCAALGGASSSVSVDLSKSYLNWARQNLVLNRIDLNAHQLVHADCLVWLAECDELFDLILLDPPSFSNSKRMQSVLDIQRDHQYLVERCLKLLAPGGQLIFSSNRRNFRLDPTLEQRYQAEDITQRTLDPDFQRPRSPHRCWLFRADAATVTD